MTADVVVAGQLARDLVLVVDDVPEAGQSRRVRERREMLGGKGANQAVAVAQLGLRPALIAVAGDDEADSRLLEQAMRDGIDVSAVIIREGTATGLITDIVDAAGHWRYLEDLPPSVLLSERDVRTGARLFDGARWASVQLQQPAAAVLTAAVLARQAGYGYCSTAPRRTGRTRKRCSAPLAAAGLTVGRPGGRPELSWARLKEQLARE
jgi:ribokinase